MRRQNRKVRDVAEVGTDTGGMTNPVRLPTEGRVPAADARRAGDRTGIFTPRRDLIALAIIVVLTLIVTGNRAVHDNWLGRHDLLAFFLQWYGYLGDRLRAGDIPAWNPNLFSGVPFAGDPESGWTFLPAMLTFPFFNAPTAFKVMVLLQLFVAGIGTYLYGRVMGFGILAALLAANLFEFGGFLYQNTYCCTVRAQLSMWIPLCFLGIELALIARSWRGRTAAAFLAGFAISQMFAGWMGQGIMDGLLLVAAYVLYRALFSPPERGAPWPWGKRVIACGLLGAAIVAIGAALDAAAILPRLAVNHISSIPDGDYTKIGQPFKQAPYTFLHIVTNIFGDGFDTGALAWGGTALVLALMAPLLARRRFAVPFYAVSTIVVWLLTLRWTPLHTLFYLIPGFKPLHEHAPAQVTPVAIMGPVMLAAATFQCLLEMRGRRQFAAALVVPGVIIAYALGWLNGNGVQIFWPMPVAALVVGVLVALMLLIPRHAGRGTPLGKTVQLLPVAILVVAFLQPTGQGLIESTIGHAVDPAWQQQFQNDPVIERAVALGLDREDANGAGAFLREQQVRRGVPFRYATYIGIGGPTSSGSPPERRFEEGVASTLTNARSMRMGLYDVSGYNPLQLGDYMSYVTALNGHIQNYHFENIYPNGFQSPLFNMLNARYIVIDNTIPQERSDVVAITKGRKEVFRNQYVTVYDNPDAFPRAWLVHRADSAAPETALKLLANGQVNAHEVVLVDGPAPALDPAPSKAKDRVTMVRYEADRITLSTSSTQSGVLVLSEVYAPGWQATVDGKHTDVLRTDGALRGVVLPPGEHTVKVWYAPAELTRGLVISGIALIAMLVSFCAVAWTWLRSWIGGGRGATGRRWTETNANRRPSPPRTRP